MDEKKLKRGGADLERLYLYSTIVHTLEGVVRISKSNFHQVGSMSDVIMRHIGRYGLALPYIRPGYKVLDFPCGSGVALEILTHFHWHGNFSYEGRDLDAATIAYCNRLYSKRLDWTKFAVDDLTRCTLPRESFDTICCIEGIEHIDHVSQLRLVKQFHQGLKEGGTLIMSSPLPEGGVSGPNPKNRFHLWELCRRDLLTMLELLFGKGNVDVVEQENLLTSGETLNCLYAVCHKRS